MKWSSFIHVAQFIDYLIDYTVDLKTCCSIMNDIHAGTRLPVNDIISKYNFKKIQAFNIIYKHLNNSSYITLINSELDHIIKQKFNTYTTKFKFLSGKGQLVYVGILINHDPPCIIIMQLVMNSLMDKLISADTTNQQLKEIYRHLHKNIIIRNKLVYYKIDNNMLSMLLKYSLSIKDTSVIKVPRIKTHDSSSRVKAQIPYLGEEEDTTPYLLQLPNLIYSLTDTDLHSLNIPIVATRNGVKFCVLGWLINYLRYSDLSIQDKARDICLNVPDTKIVVSVNQILAVFGKIIEITRNRVNNVFNLIQYDILELIKVEYTYADSLKSSPHKKVCFCFDKLWDVFDTSSKSTQHKLIKLINKTIDNYRRSKIIQIILFNEVIELTDRLGSIIKFTLERIISTNVQIVLFSVDYTPDKELFASNFLFRFCKPCSSFKNPKYLTSSFVIGNHCITRLHLSSINNYQTKFESIIDMKSNFIEFICIKLYDNLQSLKQMYNFRFFKYLPCIKCKTINTCKMVRRANKSYIQCNNCTNKLCLTCFNYHDTDQCSNISIKNVLLKMVNDNTRWYSGPTLIIGLSTDALNDMIKNAFNRCNPDCFCGNCLSHQKLTYLESDRTACNHVICPNCNWSGCFMCGQQITSHNYTDTHLISIAYKQFMIDFSLLVKDEHLPHDTTEWRCYVSVCSIFLEKKIKLVDILWILLNLSTVPVYITSKWYNVRKILLGILFAPNKHESELEPLIFIESCRAATTFADFYNIIMDHDGIKILVPIDWATKSIRDGLHTIWTNLFLVSRNQPFKTWNGFCNKENWHIQVLKRFIITKCR